MLHHFRGGRFLCTRRCWLYHTFHTFPPSSFNRKKLDTSSRKDFIPRLSDQSLSPHQRELARKETGPSVVENSKIRQHLDHIESTKHTLALEDVERYKPGKLLDCRQPSYDQKYREIQSALTQSFTKLQLRRFLKLYGLPSPSSSKGKSTLAEILMKHWDLEPLGKVQDARTDWKEKSERLYPMSPSYAFLFMGKDGTDLLNLAKRYNVHLSFHPDPLTLRIRGLKGAVKQLDGYLKSFEEDITSETARTPHGLPISPQATQLISRLSGAHVEACGDGKLLITYRRSNPVSAKRVKHLAAQAACKQLDIPDSSLHVLDESRSLVTKTIEQAGPSHFLYPFCPPQLSSGKIPSSSAFRLRLVGQWLRAGARYNMNGDGMSDISLNRESISGIKTRLLDELSADRLPNSELVVTATPGHVLFLASSGQTTFQPPIDGNVKQGIVLKWAKENPSQVLFNASVPKNLLTSWPYIQSQFQRIVYKALPVKYESIPGNPLRKTFTLEIQPRSVPYDSSSEDSDASSLSQVKRCQRSVETYADILLPSRATDIRISASRVETIAASNIPKELQSLTKKTDLTTKPIDPPLTITLDGVPYLLSSTLHIRQEHRLGSKSSKGIKYDPVIETTIDPDNGQQIMVCKVPCTNPSSDWNEFCARCDHISMVDDKPPEHLLTTMKPWFRNSDISTTRARNDGSIDHRTKPDGQDRNKDQWYPT